MATWCLIDTRVEGFPFHQAKTSKVSVFEFRRVGYHPFLWRLGILIQFLHMLLQFCQWRSDFGRLVVEWQSMDLIDDKLGCLLLVTREFFPSEVLLVMYVSVCALVICPAKLSTGKLFLDEKNLPGQ